MYNNNPIHRKTYLWKKEEGCAITITERGKKYVMNPEFTFVWEEIDDFKNIRDISESFSYKKNISFEKALSRVIDITTQMENSELISFENYLWLEDDDEI